MKNPFIKKIEFKKSIHKKFTLFFNWKDDLMLPISKIGEHVYWSVLSAGNSHFVYTPKTDLSDWMVIGEIVCEHKPTDSMMFGFWWRETPGVHQIDTGK